MTSFASVPLCLSESVSARGCDPVSVAGAWQSIEASATTLEVSADVVAASRVKRTFRSALPTGTYVPEKLGPSLDCALHVPSAASVIEVAKAPRSLPQPGTTNFDVPVSAAVPVNAVAAVGATSESASRIPFRSVMCMPRDIAGCRDVCERLMRCSSASACLVIPVSLGPPADAFIKCKLQWWDAGRLRKALAAAFTAKAKRSMVGLPTMPPPATTIAANPDELWAILLRSRVLVERAHRAAVAAAARRYERGTDGRLTATLRRSRWRVTTGRPLPRVMRGKIS